MEPLSGDHLALPNEPWASSLSLCAAKRRSAIFSAVAALVLQDVKCVRATGDLYYFLERRKLETHQGDTYRYLDALTSKQT